MKWNKLLWTGLLVFGFCQKLYATPIFEIQWLDQEWLINTTELPIGQAIAEAQTNINALDKNSIPTVKTLATAQGGSSEVSSASVQVHASRSFKVVRTDPNEIEVNLNSQVRGRVYRKESGDAKFDAIAQVLKKDTVYNTQAVGCDTNALLCDNKHKNPGSSNNSGESANADLNDSGFLDLSADYTVHGNLRGNPNSNIGLENNRVRGVMDLRDPLTLSDLDSLYYDIDWTSAWSATGEENSEPDNEHLEAALEYISAQVSAAIPGGPLAQEVGQLIIEELLGNIFAQGTVEIAQFDDGVSLIYAESINGGNAHVRLLSERDFQINPNDHAPALLSFNGWLNGLLKNTENTYASLDLAQVSVAGAGLFFSKSALVDSIGTLVIDTPVNATGWVKTGRVYTVDTIFNSFAQSNINALTGELAVADFASSFGGTFSVEAAFYEVPEPGSFGIFGAGLLGLGLLKRRRQLKI